ncbi:hypothetical protein EVAR_55265_1 [Eumeta japonica]|uniref:Uncharacterized protein n=1 Tax=Eumeta variegata TaxID=151549 RepID=A0A4C1Z4Y2_EUMVA|nr:hypothetical protein EVAR_55265_1 [Eumeta japonica]
MLALATKPISPNPLPPYSLATFPNRDSVNQYRRRPPGAGPSAGALTFSAGRRTYTKVSYINHSMFQNLKFHINNSPYVISEQERLEALEQYCNDKIVNPGRQMKHQPACARLAFYWLEMVKSKFNERLCTVHRVAGRSSSGHYCVPTHSQHVCLTNLLRGKATPFEFPRRLSDPVAF